VGWEEGLRTEFGNSSRAAEHEPSGRCQTNHSLNLLIGATFSRRGGRTQSAGKFAVFIVNILRATLKYDGIHTVLTFRQFQGPENVANLIVCSRGAAVWMSIAILNCQICMTCEAAACTLRVSNGSMRTDLRPRTLRDGEVGHLQPALAPVFVDHAGRWARCSSRRNKQLQMFWKRTTSISTKN
jgi:hypothetical protein